MLVNITLLSICLTSPALDTEVSGRVRAFLSDLYRASVHADVLVRVLATSGPFYMPQSSGEVVWGEVSLQPKPCWHSREYLDLTGQVVGRFTSDQVRSTSATLHAWAMQPRGVWGGSPSKISLMVPRPWSVR